MINLVILLGNLGADPEVRQLQNGGSVANFNMATTVQWTGKDEQKNEKTEWHRIVAYDRLGEICGQYLRKGSRVYIEGRVQTRQWLDRDGNKRYTTEIIAKEMKMLDTRSTGQGGVERQSFPAQGEPVEAGDPGQMYKPFTGQF